MPHARAHLLHAEVHEARAAVGGDPRLVPHFEQRDEALGYAPAMRARSRAACERANAVHGGEEDARTAAAR